MHDRGNKAKTARRGPFSLIYKNVSEIVQFRINALELSLDVAQINLFQILLNGSGRVFLGNFRQRAFRNGLLPFGIPKPITRCDYHYYDYCPNCFVHDFYSVGVGDGLAFGLAVGVGLFVGSSSTLGTWAKLVATLLTVS